MVRNLLALVAFSLGWLAHPLAGAEPQEVRIPFGPGAQELARQWVAPEPSGEVAPESGVSLRDVQVNPFSVVYVIGSKDQPKSASIHLRFEPAGEKVSLRSEVNHPEAKELAAMLTKRLESAVSPTRLKVQWPTHDAPEEAKSSSPRGPPWWLVIEQNVVIPLLLLLLLGLILSASSVGTVLKEVGRIHWMGLGALTVVVSGALWMGADTVLYHSGHGWALAELIHQGDITDPHAGALAPRWSHVLGWLAPAGQEAFLASRVGTVLSVFLCWIWLFVLTQQPRVAWIATLLLCAQPALFLAGRSEYVATPGMALMLLAMTLATLAGRERRPSLVLAAFASLALLASFRALGPVVWPMCTALLFVPKGRDQGIRSRWLVGVAALVALLAIPSLLRVLGVGTTYMPSEGLSLLPDFGQTQLLGDTRWSSPVLGLGALAGVCVWLGRKAGPQSYRSRLLALCMLGVVWAVVYATQHVAGTYLNTPRYHIWLLVPSCAAAGALGGFVWKRHRWERAAAIALVGVMTWGLVGPWSLSLERHPEARQLDAWRATAEYLPKGATLWVPERRGEHEIKLPFTELERRRPDIQVHRGESPSKGRLFVFKPLDCLRPTLRPTSGIRDDCRSLERGWRSVEEASRETSWRVPTEDDKGTMEGANDADYWVYPPLEDPPGRVGLWTR
jgi:hypothetical protein